jgi:hypothetical protein
MASYQFDSLSLETELERQLSHRALSDIKEERSGENHEAGVLVLVSCRVRTWADSDSWFNGVFLACSYDG